MSKQSEAKAAQHYTRDKQNCQTCKHFAFDEVKQNNQWTGSAYIEEKNLRCSIGGFKVHKTAVCVRFERQEAA